jgi:6-phosphogluconolactonase
VNPARQSSPHPHSINYSPDERFAIVCDLGLDRIMVYRVDFAAGSLTLDVAAGVAAHPGSGPRHLAFHPNGRFAFVINEIGNTIVSYNYDAATGKLSEIESVPTLPDGWTGENTAADIHVSPSGRFVYGSNRGNDSIVIYGVDPSTGRLSYVGHQSTFGKTPRGFVVDASGRLLLAANQDSDNIVTFQIDQATGLLSHTGETACPSPVCLKLAAIR